MNNLIVYFSKHGAVKRAVEIIESKVKTDVINIIEKKELDIQKYDNIIISSSIYVGAVSKEIKYFIKSNYNILKEKNIYFLIISGQKDQIENILSQNFSEEHKKLFKEIVYGGYEFNLENMNFFERIIIKKMAKVKESVSYLEIKNLEKLAEKLK